MRELKTTLNPVEQNVLSDSDLSLGHTTKWWIPGDKNNILIALTTEKVDRLDLPKLH